MIRVLLADDQSLVRAGFRMILKAEPDIEVVGEPGDGREAIAKAQRVAGDVVLMDIRMPILDGIEATRHITASEQAPRLVVLTAFDQDEYVYEALRAGASAFLRLIARGLSNAEIAAELIVSEHTTKTHVASILQKLDPRNRVQAVVLAYESGLVRPGR